MPWDKHQHFLDRGPRTWSQVWAGPRIPILGHMQISPTPIPHAQGKHIPVRGSPHFDNLGEMLMILDDVLTNLVDLLTSFDEISRL